MAKCMVRFFKLLIGLKRHTFCSSWVPEFLYKFIMLNLLITLVKSFKSILIFLYCYSINYQEKLFKSPTTVTHFSTCDPVNFCLVYFEAM